MSRIDSAIGIQKILSATIASFGIVWTHLVHRLLNEHSQVDPVILGCCVSYLVSCLLGIVRLMKA